VVGPGGSAQWRAKRPFTVADAIGTDALVAASGEPGGSAFFPDGITVAVWTGGVAAFWTDRVEESLRVLLPFQTSRAS